MYVFNTTNEDQKVSKVLSGREANDTVIVPDLSGFDAQTLEELRLVQSLLFTSCNRLSDRGYNVAAKVLDVAMASVVRHYPLMKKLHPNNPSSERLEACARQCGISSHTLLGWSIALTKTYTEEKKPKPHANEPTAHEFKAVMKHQEAVINELMTINKQLSDRVLVIEKERGINDGCAKRSYAATDVSNGKTEVIQSMKRKKKAAVTNLSSMWLKWYSSEPPIWKTSVANQKLSGYRQVTAFMKVFLSDGFMLDRQQSSFADDVLMCGKHAEAAITQFLGEHGIKAHGGGSVLKHMPAAPAGVARRSNSELPHACVRRAHRRSCS